ncbi:hypothetical protein [Actinomadura sp. 7K507]|uniref:hypothetical protein n=1 Tax=Actinomadura sp. 7K507 TaxID=2530365 RepID=UPI0010505733|nr:hypothetical protein [Actinomadura sp. 7K507]TDC77004.1 hypothetical protein E1285_39280 [Actinomadura sp. 7K507]
MDLLERLSNRRGKWCGTVAWECDRSSMQPGLGAMAQAHDIFGEPLRPENGAEHVTTRTLRERLAKPGDAPHKHLGEAETLAIISCRSLQSIFVTDDTDVPSLAQEHGIKTVTTWDLLRLAGHVKYVDADTLWAYIQTLRDHGRGRPPRVHDRTSFDQWLTGDS